MRIAALTLVLGACSDGPPGNVPADGGAIEASVDALGSACVREADCPGDLACRVERIDDGDGFPEEVWTTCGAENRGAGATGDACATEDDCRTGICQLGRCGEVCTAGSCPVGFACNDVSSVASSIGGVYGPAPECPPAVRAAARFSACLPEQGTIDVTLAAAPSGSWVAFDVPSLAASMTIVAETGTPDAFVGVWALLDPQGASLYALPLTQPEFLAQPIRYYPGDRISAMQVPNTPDVTFARGVHCFQIASDAGGEVASRVRVKMAPGGVPGGGSLALDVHFLDLSGLGCGVDGLNASSATTHALWQDAFDGIGGILAQAGIGIASISYHDLLGRPDLDVIDYLDGPDGDGVFEELNALFSAGEGVSGDSLDVFLVRHIEGKAGISGAIPGPPGVHGMPHAGVAVGMDAVCATPLAQLVAHEVAHQLGLFHNIDTGVGDPIDDTDDGTDNLMFPSASGTELTPGQVFVLRANPLVR